MLHPIIPISDLDNIDYNMVGKLVKISPTILNVMLRIVFICSRPDRDVNVPDDVDPDSLCEHCFGVGGCHLHKTCNEMINTMKMLGMVHSIENIKYEIKSYFSKRYYESD